MAERTSEQSIFLHAIGLPSPADRAAYLDEVCRDNQGLRTQLEALLAAHDRLGGGIPPTGPEAAEPAESGAMGAMPQSTEAVGTLIAGRYKLLEAIGEGGMGTVWMAQQTEPVKRPVAVKLIKASMAAAHVHSGKLDRAVPLYQEAAARARKQMGMAHPETRQFLRELCHCYELMKQFD